ncbi:MAG: regulator of protease activity HflC (stomatin/prohibitin superfamily) [Glaciecola sp.]|jgi:regulator of protease activity HflC (stomatin/prohibitin superfamily)
MDNQSTTQITTERATRPTPGSRVLGPLLVLFPTLFALALYLIKHDNEAFGAFILVTNIITSFITALGLYTVAPNTSKVLVFFGKYRGTVLKEGFYWSHPFTKRTKISLRANNLASDTIKVNDLYGNPIEIGAIVVWRVTDTARACFDVEDYDHYVRVQIEAALRELAKTHPYEQHSGDGGITLDADTVSLRSDSAAISKELTMQLQKRLDRAGVEVLEARISHLAYALEIASAMLQRQQAAAIISARRLIVDGAVGMVEHALKDLADRGVLDLDDERKATMVSNLLVVLCSHTAPSPVINTGGIYN